LVMTIWRLLRRLGGFLRHIPGVSLTLHPRLYAAARVRGLGSRTERK
jgi:hypothetical protein